MALTLKKKLESPEFILILCVWENILKSMQFVSKKLKSIDLHLHQALEQLNTAISDIKLMRENYDTIVEKAKEMCESWSIPFTFHQSRERYSKVFPGEIYGDRRLTITKDNFKVTVFYPVIDTILSQLQFRFIGLNTICDYFKFLIPFNMISMTEDLLIKSTYDFIEKYRDDVSSDFTRQIVSLRDFFISKDGTSDIKKMTIKDLSLFILNENLSSIFPDVFTATMICITIPITSASVERSFSKLKLIKNYLRNTMSQDRLSSLALLNIERLQTAEIDVDNIINIFANAKVRKMNFLH